MIFINYLAVAASSAVLVLAMSKHLTKSLAISSGYVFALIPINIIYASTTNAEILFGACIILSVSFFLLFLRGQDFKRKIYFALSVLFLSLSQIFRPLWVIMLIAFIIYILFYIKTCLQNKLTMIFIFLAASLLTSSLLNLLVFETTGFFPPKSGYGWNLYIGSTYDQTWSYTSQDEFDFAQRKLKTPNALHADFAEKALENYAKMPLGAIVSHMQKPWASFENGSYLARFAPEGTASFISFINGGILILGCISLVYITFSKSRQGFMFLPLYIDGNMLILSILEVSPRYSLSFYMIFALSSIIFLDKLKRM
jgi:hypothetical protein